MCSNDTELFYTFDNYCVTVQELSINICLFLFGFAIIATNGWILNVLCKHRQRADSPNYFITNLVVADLMIGVFVCYDVFYNILQFKIFVECLLRQGLFITVNLVSVWTLGLLTCDRYIKIQYPFIYMRKYSKLKVQLVLVFLWIVAFGFGVLPFFGWNTEDIWQICNFFGTMEQGFVILIIVLFSVPLVIMIFAYIRITMTSWIHLKAIKEMESHSRHVSFTIQTWKTAKTACIIVGAYMFCWSPVGIFIIVVYTTDVEYSLSPRMSENVIFTYLLGIGIFNSILNPIIYAMKLEVVKKELRASCLVTLCSKVFKTQKEDQRNSVSQITEEIGLSL